MTVYHHLNNEQVPAGELKFGNENEYHIFSIKEDEKLARVFLEGLETVREIEATVNPIPDFDITEEVASWMIETMPLEPYNQKLPDCYKMILN